ncbi:hypothetical protein [Bacillus sp. PBL-C9]|uniref:MFS transporter n=1 Tax=Bacillus sp. PBL-C9 TaxID=3097548 RepID=UPI002A24D2D9|nr:hypothetical protein [Bacillus sp. PBL-C9]MDX9636774.1 hypothetical protein [Bacillus sp. PBL-C9]
MDKYYEQPTATEYSKRWLALFVLLLGTFMVILDSFIVNIAIPTIQVQLHASASQIQFIVVAYVLSYAVLLIMVLPRRQIRKKENIHNWNECVYPRFSYVWICYKY